MCLGNLQSGGAVEGRGVVAWTVWARAVASSVLRAGGVGRVAGAAATTGGEEQAQRKPVAGVHEVPRGVGRLGRKATTADLGLIG